MDLDPIRFSVAISRRFERDMIRIFVSARFEKQAKSFFVQPKAQQHIMRKSIAQKSEAVGMPFQPRINLLIDVIHIIRRRGKIHQLHISKIA